MDAAKAARAAKLIGELMARLDDEGKVVAAPRPDSSRRPLGLGLKPGIDPTKPGQLADDL